MYVLTHVTLCTHGEASPGTIPRRWIAECKEIHGFDFGVSANWIFISTVESSCSFVFLPKSWIIRLSNFCQSSGYEMKFNEFCISLITNAVDYHLYVHILCLFLNPFFVFFLFICRISVQILYINFLKNCVCYILPTRIHCILTFCDVF